MSAFAACSGSTSGAGTGDNADSGAAGSGGTNNAGTGGGGSGGIDTAGSGGASGTAGAGGTTTAVPGVDLSGTWISQIQTVATATFPIAGSVDVNLHLVMRLVVSRKSDQNEFQFDVCDLTTVTTPDPATLTVTFTPAVLATFTTTGSEDAHLYQFGDTVPIPALTILSGIDASGSALDSDEDSKPGVTIPTNFGGTLPLNAYAGLIIQPSLSTTLMFDDSIRGTAALTVNGTVFGSDNAALTDGSIAVIPKTESISFTAHRLAGDVPCSQVLEQFQ